MQGLKSAISFFTIIPVKADLNKNIVFFFTITGAITGLMAASIFYLTSFINQLLASVASVSFLIIIYGFNHADAVLDLGDTFMVHDPEKKKIIIKDVYHGTGSVVTFFIIYIITISLLSSFNSIQGSIALILSETISRFSMLMSMYKSNSFSGGISEIFISYFDKPFKITFFNFLVIILIFLIFYKYIIFTMFSLISIVISYYFKSHEQKIFNGINGDIIGFTGELSRLISLLLILISFKLI
ncbi:adenosylcobinamide-GDP ribazoletransferase [Picrophilus oshimae]|uniref:Adenosylcobinamide-GDP ribazoletransferase n=2 Tax=Picrophilus torridus (strain ATCC 700027 / DSM 9790 / JCM 10055 / NBRC 100828 / KAW 2/3) TaxID=1122961 RepID=COBS_PICTO|nr:adenosylcobinamide-GDP ribazoletransferase [Picrophilus oshimae]Q6L174.1 RecName: Full=Adenosylcobinamide-GDP ribazoletransferase; AltName: Full=Cobalamin synthase; AltName: Full=Cobalamin-5'-phosphate synthase [Picrophilus oshimae DSM 9789]AAT43278.1 cobalamin [5'-phosphate] synthase [Picrophilus oshimae DSM 9789]SMD30415.1 cobalamin-5'-phosphate synthase [Picrophilus oshimae DSM 9789]